MEDRIYKIADGRLWDTAKADWTDETEARIGDVIYLISAEGQSDEAYLAKTLAFYSFPLGELLTYSEKGIKEELARLDAEYLTPRTLAGLSVNDQEAIARWEEHERLAAPLRKRIAELEKS